MQYHYLLIIISLFASSCFNKHNEAIPRDYVLINDDGIFVEKFDTTNISENRFTANNKAFVEGNTWIYDYYYEDIEGNRYKFEEWEGTSKLDFQDRANAWSFISIDSLTERSIDKVELKVRPGLQLMINHIPDYNQPSFHLNIHKSMERKILIRIQE